MKKLLLFILCLAIFQQICTANVFAQATKKVDRSPREKANVIIDTISANTKKVLELLSVPLAGIIPDPKLKRIITKIPDLSGLIALIGRLITEIANKEYVSRLNRLGVRLKCMAKKKKDRGKIKDKKGRSVCEILGCDDGCVKEILSDIYFVTKPFSNAMVHGRDMAGVQVDGAIKLLAGVIDPQLEKIVLPMVNQIDMIFELIGQLDKALVEKSKPAVAVAA